MNFEAIAAYSGAVGSIVAIIAVVADHLWARAANNRRDARQEYLANVSTPISEIMLEIVEFRCSVSEWVTADSDVSLRTIRRSGARLNSKINHLLNEAAKSEFGGGNQWIELSTQPFEKSLEELSDDRRNLDGKTLNGELHRFQNALSDLRAERTPQF